MGTDDKGSIHDFYKYSKTSELSDAVEHLTIQSHWINGDKVHLLIENGFKLNRIDSQKLNADPFFTLFFTRRVRS